MNSNLAAPLVVLAVLTSCASTQRGSSQASRAQFERMKSLVGAWVATSDSEGPAAGAEVVYRLTGGGSALVETMLPGAEHEMVSVYYVDGDRLVMTHYCAAGNQPFMVARDTGDPDRIAFECVGGANVDMKHGLHMQRAEFRFLDAARIDANWTAFVDGKPDHTARFALVRSWR